jgi:hypothetical protein
MSLNSEYDLVKASQSSSKGRVGLVRRALGTSRALSRSLVTLHSLWARMFLPRSVAPLSSLIPLDFCTLAGTLRAEARPLLPYCAPKGRASRYARVLCTYEIGARFSGSLKHLAEHLWAGFGLQPSRSSLLQRFVHRPSPPFLAALKEKRKNYRAGSDA